MSYLQPNDNELWSKRAIVKQLFVDLRERDLGQRAISVAYNTGQIGLGSINTVIGVAIEDEDALGGDIAVLDVVGTHPNIGRLVMVKSTSAYPIVQEIPVGSTTFDEILVNAVDETIVLNSPVGDVPIMTLDNDTMTVGSSTIFDTIEMDLTTTSNRDVEFVFEYSQSGGWTVFLPNDGTGGCLVSNGSIVWNASGLISWDTDGGLYKIRMTRTRNGVQTTPVCNQLKKSSAVEYKWDNLGVISCKSVIANPGPGIIPAENGQISMSLDSDTSVVIRAKGLDGTVRSVNLTLT